MRNVEIFKFLAVGFAVALSFSACSSMDTNSAKDGNWPTDFVVSEYSELNPDIANAQRKTSVASANTEKSCKINTLFSDTSETAKFLADSIALKSIFTDYASFSATYWPGYELFTTNTLYADFIQVLFTSFHVCGNTASEDVAYLVSMPVDSSLISMEYLLIGATEGRAYRYCLEGEAKVLQNPSQGVVINEAKGEYDYSDSYYCLNKADQQKYLIEE
jgi:hypothetical protein